MANFSFDNPNWHNLGATIKSCVIKECQLHQRHFLDYCGDCLTATEYAALMAYIKEHYKGSTNAALGYDVGSIYSLKPEHEYTESKVRVSDVYPNPNLSHVCPNDPEHLERSLSNMMGKCWTIECEVKAKCHPECRWEKLAGIYYSDKGGALVAISTCGSFAVWMD